MLRLERVTKRYGDVTVLDDVTFTLRRGEVHGLLGLNGAGKSTLVKLLSGAIIPTSGTVELDEAAITLTPAEAIRLGVITVSQEVDDALYLDLPVYENVVPWQTIERIRPRELKRRAITYLERVGLEIDVTEPVGRFPLSVKQRILIARALASDATYLLLDEPTAALSTDDAASLLALLQSLAEEGVGILLITHRSDELSRVTTTSTFLRDGRIAYEGPFQPLSDEDIHAYLSGAGMTTAVAKATPGTDERIRAELTLPTFGTELSLTAYKGEVVGIGGVTGSGKTELIEALFGLSGVKQRITLDGKPLNIREPHQAVRSGFALVPEERRKQGLFLDDSIERNVLAIEGKANAVTRVLASLRVKYDQVGQPVRELSGGNQQKIVLSKWLLEDRDVYLLDEPTKGVDVTAKRDIYELVTRLAKDGKTVIFTSSEPNELELIANRTLWLDRGRWQQKGGV
ncbi:sugar ABC transporter ATP-binding protein [Exiguobacterium sp. SL-10]|uniref:sugar ABC transporter ATP-binding protein n=1 Tax=Exiguobacterium sp. SL-10 TaxID=2510962 RepID=UPI00103EFEA2|nr:sugar ABC transporter ATP-binding protein [Exiguobacterium sp. SL-10]TCI29949.1 sugar ABC transporter ATP-binding protein [Exiguobacterium sp. SL-10]